MSKSSPARIRYKAARAARRENDPEVSERARHHARQARLVKEREEREARIKTDSERLRASKAMDTIIYNAILGNNV